jgi:FdhD protein
VIPDGVERRRVQRLTAQGHAEVEDLLVVERPLMFVADEVPLLTTMRTPGHDLELVLGHLRTESIIETADDAMIELKPGAESDVVCIALRQGRPAESLGALRRVGTSVSSCGVCGRLAPFPEPPAPPRGLTVQARDTQPLLDAMRSRQPLFDHSGGVHAAALFDDVTAAPLVVREDIGRHNALDKVIGWLLMHPEVQGPLALATSGRASFEIVHKAAIAGIGTIVSVSAASTLAVDVAVRHGVTLYGFVRDGRTVAYHRADGRAG